MDTTSASLLERLRRPADAAAWDRFVALYTPLLYHWGRRLSLDPQDVGDLVQEVFATLVERLPTFDYDPARRFRGWLWTVTHNAYRARARRPRTLVPLEGQLEVEGPDTTVEFTEVEYQRFLTGRAMELMKADFQPMTWQAFWEHAVNSRSAPEVAAELGLSVGAVYAAKSRVLARLREELRGLLD